MTVSSEYIKIRPAVKDDLDDIIAINIECLPEHYPYSFWLDHLEKWSDIFYVVEVNGRIVGYTLSRIEEGITICEGKKGKMGHIVSVAVKEEYRGRGFATAMISAVIYIHQNVYNVNEIRLEVRVSNTKAIKLYEKLGFVKVARIKNYYLDGEDSYIMVKNLISKPCESKIVD